MFVGKSVDVTVESSMCFAPPMLRTIACEAIAMLTWL